MYCPNCGTEVSTEAKYCMKCGCLLSDKTDIPNGNNFTKRRTPKGNNNYINKIESREKLIRILVSLLIMFIILYVILQIIDHSFGF